MEIIVEHQTPQASMAADILPEDHRQWPRSADQARESLLRELNRWSRDNHWPTTLNSWIAEEAVRREW